MISSSNLLNNNHREPTCRGGKCPLNITTANLAGTSMNCCRRHTGRSARSHWRRRGRNNHTQTRSAPRQKAPNAKPSEIIATKTRLAGLEPISPDRVALTVAIGFISEPFIVQFVDPILNRLFPLLIWAGDVLDKGFWA